MITERTVRKLTMGAHSLERNFLVFLFEKFYNAWKKRESSIPKDTMVVKWTVPGVRQGEKLVV